MNNMFIQHLQIWEDGTIKHMYKGIKRGNVFQGHKTQTHQVKYKNYNKKLFADDRNTL